jgi:aerobic C4-dicarboxylate transport protein
MRVATPSASTTAVARSRPWYARLYVQVLAAIVAGVLVGHFAPGVSIALKPLGDGFVKLVKMVIAPVVFLTVVTGIAGLKDLRQAGGMAARALGYFLVVSTFALFIGLAVANLAQPGAGLSVDPASLDAKGVADYAGKAQALTFSGFVLEAIPETMVGAFTGGNILQVLFVAIPFGIALSLIGEAGAPALRVLQSLSDAVFRLTAIFMAAAPIGAFGAMAFTVGKYGLAVIAKLASLVAAFYGTSALFILVVLGAIAALNGFSILRLIRYLRAELLLVLGTSSSEAALPSLMLKLERAGAPKSVVGVVTPLGYSFNLDGTNIYMTLASLFIAQALNIHLGLGDQLLLLGVAMLSSKGAAGVTGAGFITLAATLQVTGTVPVAGLALILGVDRFMSQCRALTNFIGNAVATLVVARWEGVLDRDQLRAALAGEAPPITVTAGPAVATGQKWEGEATQ